MYNIFITILNFLQASQTPMAGDEVC
jgi:hypothetical protein